MAHDRRAFTILASGALISALALTALAAPASAAKKPRCMGQVATIVGTNKADILKGSARRDVIVARAGNDIIVGRGGNDIICAGPGNDRVAGQAGHDRIAGQAGVDRLFGGGGVDRLMGNAGDDVLAGQAGPDILAGGVGNDRLDGGIGVDTCLQGSGSGVKVRCELPATPPDPVPPGPTTGTLVIGGTGSGQIGGGFYRERSDERYGDWEASSYCRTGRVAVGGPDYWYRRFAMEYPLSGLPDGSAIDSATLAIANSTAPATGQEIRGYAGDGKIEVADIEVDGTPVPLETTTDSRTTVDVKSLLTPAVVGSGWAGFSVRHGSTYVSEEWECLPSDINYPILTVKYTVP